MKVNENVTNQMKIVSYMKFLCLVPRNQEFKERIRNTLSRYESASSSSSNVNTTSSNGGTSDLPNISFQYLQTNSFDDSAPNDVFFYYDPVFDEPGRALDEGGICRDAAANAYFEDGMFAEDPLVLDEILKIENLTGDVSGVPRSE